MAFCLVATQLFLLFPYTCDNKKKMSVEGEQKEKIAANI
jgi:hypothetical protein